MSSKLEILSLFGFGRDPFHDCAIESADGLRVKKLLSMGIAARAQISIVGERGVGKTRAVNAMLREMKTAKIARILTPDKSRVTANDIQEALLTELAPTERIRQDREIRVRQLRRILGEVSQKVPVIVVIEESHRLHGNTLRSLKNLRELDWMGQTHLFAVILIGQSDSTQKIGLAEVRLRTETICMHGLTQTEIANYIQETVGEKIFPPASIAAVCDIPDARNYLDLQDLLVRAMSNALAAGRDEVMAEDLAEFSGKPAHRKAAPAQKSEKPKASSALQSVIGRRQGNTGLRAVEETA
jgi:type II secretory pathway predicted ATPase ExeA